MGKQMSGNFAVYRGHCLELRSCNDEGQILLATSDSTLASSSGLTAKGDGYYRAWVPRAAAQEVYCQAVHGEVNGVRVLIISDEGAYYFVSAQSALHGFRQVDKALWEGNVDKAAVSRSWTEKKPLVLR